MRAEFPWIPVYSYLYFNSDPAWICKSVGIPFEGFVYPSVYYRELLKETRTMVIVPPRGKRPLTADLLSGNIDALRDEIAGANPNHSLQAAVWALAKEGLDLAERWSKQSRAIHQGCDQYE